MQTQKPLTINRVWAMPNKWTFQIRPIKKLVLKYVRDGKGWIDPFSGMSTLAEFTNDLNPKMPSEYHLDSLDFVKQLNGSGYKGVLFDPPYSCVQVSRCYENVGIKATSIDTSANFYSRVMNAVCDKIKSGGYTISCGWNSAGFGKKRGFEIIEILLVSHGGHHNDTIVTVERKVQNNLGMY